MLVVKAKVKEYANLDGRQLNVSGDFAEALSRKAEALVQDACRRARENGRSTVMAKDL